MKRQAQVSPEPPSSGAEPPCQLGAAFYTPPPHSTRPGLVLQATIIGLSAGASSAYQTHHKEPGMLKDERQLSGVKGPRTTSGRARRMSSKYLQWSERMHA